jgi:hypothetical protein
MRLSIRYFHAEQLVFDLFVVFFFNDNDVLIVVKMRSLELIYFLLFINKSENHGLHDIKITSMNKWA